MADQQTPTPDSTSTAPAPQQQQPPASTAPSTPAAPPMSARDKFEAFKAEVRAKESPPPSAEPAAPAKPDPDLAAVERILSEDRRVKEAKKKVDEERQQTASERAAWEKEKEQERAELDLAKAVKAAKEKGDAVGLLRALGYTDKDIWDGGEDSLLFKLADAKVKQPELTLKEQVDKAIAAKDAEKEEAQKTEAAQKAKEAADFARQKHEEAVALMEQSKEAFAKNAFDVVGSSPDKYPSLVRWGVRAGAVAEYAWNVLQDSNGEQELSEEEALNDLEAHFAQKSREALGIGQETEPKPEPPVHRGVSINPSWQAQTGAPVSTKARPADLRGKFEALKEDARKKFAERR